MFAELDAAKYVALTTFKRDGTGVTTTVWLAGSRGRYLVMTQAGTGKVKRIRNNPQVHVAASDARGRVAPDSTLHTATARLLDGVHARHALGAISTKYGFIAGAVNLLNRARLRKENNPIAIEIVLDAATA